MMDGVRPGSVGGLIQAEASSEKPLLESPMSMCCSRALEW
jgi:hypothetical protein